MKILHITSLTEGQAIKQGAYITIGRHYDYISRTEQERNGWYMKLDLPFIQKYIMDYTCPRTFNTYPTMCQFQMLLMIRRPKKRIELDVIDSREVGNHYEIRKMRPHLFIYKAWNEIDYTYTPGKQSPAYVIKGAK